MTQKELKESENREGENLTVVLNDLVNENPGEDAAKVDSYFNFILSEVVNVIVLRSILKKMATMSRKLKSVNSVLLCAISTAMYVHTATMSTGALLRCFPLYCGSY